MLLAMVLSVVTSAEAVEVTWTGAAGHAANPQWSPDGTWMSFEVNNNADKVELFLVKVNSGNPSGMPQKIVIPGSSSSFSSGGAYAANPNWHPKGPLIFEAANSGGTTRLYYLMPGGSSPAEYLNATQIAGSLSWPSLSPDGTKLVFTSGATGLGDIYLFSQSTNKVSAAMSTKESENAPRFCADGTTLVFSRKNYGTEDLFVWRGSGDATPLRGGNGDQTRPVCVGDKVVYYTNERGDDHWDLATVPLAGGEPTIIAKDIRLPLRSPPSVTPDGTAVLYGSSSPSQDSYVWIAPLDGSTKRKINTGLTAVGDPDMVLAGGRTWLSFTALPASGADWRQLHIVDATGQ